MFQVGPGTPLPALMWDSGMLDMELRVWREKKMLAHHLQGLGETLARQVRGDPGQAGLGAAGGPAVARAGQRS